MAWVGASLPKNAIAAGAEKQKQVLTSVESIRKACEEDPTKEYNVNFTATLGFAARNFYGMHLQDDGNSSHRPI